MRCNNLASAKGENFHGKFTIEDIDPIKIEGIEMGDDRSRKSKVALVRIHEMVRDPRKVSKQSKFFKT